MESGCLSSLKCHLRVEGWFTRGNPQEKNSTPKGQSSGNKPPTNRTTATAPSGVANTSLICSFPSVTPLKATAVLADALGRERDGRVAAAE
jgi:hypothetical protein